MKLNNLPHAPFTRTRTLAAVAAVCAATLTVGCGSSSTSTSSTSCSVTAENTQVLTTMRSWYYWYQSLPATVDPAAYATPDKLLDALRQQPLDIFSYITTQSADQAFYGAGQYVGFGLGLALTADNLLKVTRVFPGTPAEGGGLARGDTITAVNGVAVATLISNGQLDNALAVSGPGVNLVLAFTDLAGRAHTVTLTSAVVTQPSVEQVKSYSVGGRTVGYVLFNSFIDTSNAALDQAFAGFTSQGVTQLVIDERYNGGGEVSVAQHLASLIAGNARSGQTLGVLTFNDKHTDQNQTVKFQTVSNALNLNQVVFITSGGTASASEFIINGLGPYAHVVTVGAATFGKPVGENGFDVCLDVLYPITFKIENAVGYGDYFNGLPPTCPAGDDLTHALGDPGEASLATALNYATTGACAPTPGVTALAEAPRVRWTARSGWRQLLNAY